MLIHINDLSIFSVKFDDEVKFKLPSSEKLNEIFTTYSVRFSN